MDPGRREDFVRRALAREKPITELCREYAISRKTGYKWLKRYRERGGLGLMSEPRRPADIGVEASAEMVMEIVRLRNEHPTWGPKHLWEMLAQTVDDPAAVPTAATIARVLRRAGLSRHRWRRRERRVPTPAVEMTVREPNDLWTADFKGWWTAPDGSRCEPLTVRDALSRYVLSLRILSGASHAQVRAVFEELFRRHGLPRAIQTDHGMPFVSSAALGGLTKLSAWWISLGIVLVSNHAGLPDDTSARERLHGDIRIDIETNAARSIQAQQAVCDEWVKDFNYARPHEALEGQTPAEVYRPSGRKLPVHSVVVGGYPEGCELRKVSGVGVFTYGGDRVYATKSLAGFHIGVQRAAGGDALVWFYDVLLGHFTPGRDHSVRPIQVTSGTQEGVTPTPLDTRQENTLVGSKLGKLF